MKKDCNGNLYTKQKQIQTKGVVGRFVVRLIYILLSWYLRVGWWDEILAVRIIGWYIGGYVGRLIDRRVTGRFVDDS